MWVRVHTFEVPKAGSSWQEYEDAAAVEPARAVREDFAGPWLTAAVADGASEALLAGRWARELVNTFADAGPKADLNRAFDAATARWDAVEDDYRQGRAETDNPIAWYEEDGLRRGAYATIVGVRLLDGDTEGAMAAWALGDACLFQIRDDALAAAFPLDDPATFGINPALAPSRPIDAGKVTAHIEYLETNWRSGDVLLLASDAVACWFLTEAATGRTPWRTLCALDTAEGIGDFASWIEDRRASGSMRNDDSTLLRIHLL